MKRAPIYFLSGAKNIFEEVRGVVKEVCDFFETK